MQANGRLDPGGSFNPFKCSPVKCLYLHPPGWAPTRAAPVTRLELSGCPRPNGRPCSIIALLPDAAAEGFVDG